MKIVGYSNRFSVRPGQTICFMVSSEEPTYRAEVVRLRHTDENPRGPGWKSETLRTSVSGEYRGRKQDIHVGSHAVVPHHPSMSCPDGFTLQAWIYPTTPHKGVQGLMTKFSEARPVGLRPLYRRGWLARFVDWQWRSVGEGSHRRTAPSRPVGFRDRHL